MYYFFLISYTILGAGIKYIDDAFDRKTFTKSLAILITPLLSILGAYAILIDPVSATILLAVLAGVLLKGKIDNIAFAIGFVMVLLIVFIAGVEFLVLPLIILSAAGMLDEVGNDYIDSKKDTLNLKNPFHVFAKYFLGHRWIMKTAIILLVILSIMPIYFIFAMILFDYAYLSVTAYSELKEKMTYTTTMSKIIGTVGYIFK